MSVETVRAVVVRRERAVRALRRGPADGQVDGVTSAGDPTEALAGGAGSTTTTGAAVEARVGGVGSAAGAVAVRPPGVASLAPTGAAVSEARIGVIVSSARPEAGVGRESWWRGIVSRLNSRAVRTHFGTVAGVVILGALLWRLGTGVLLDGLRRIDMPTLLAALGIGVVTTVLSAWRWALVARGLRIRLPLGAAVADYYRALFLNAALPGGVLGDVHRAVRHGQSAGDMGRGVRSVVLERVAGQVALTVLGGAVLLTMPSPVLAETRHFAPLVGLAVAGALAVMVALRMNQAPSRRGRALRATLAEAREGLLSRRNWPGVVASSVLILAGHIAMFVLAARVAGSGASVAALLPLAVLALIAMGLPLNVGGFGPREGVAAWAFGAAGLGASSGVAVSVVYGVLSFVAALPGLAVLVARWYTGLRAGSGRAAAAPEPARETDYPRALPASPVSPVSAPESSAEVRSEKYAPKESARAASSSFPFSAEPSEGRPMTPESV
ncbi:lysylphosphatidylglycerol synthase transmembrane domain-containing protein [Streptomyces sp. NPDC002092]